MCFVRRECDVVSECGTTIEFGVMSFSLLTSSMGI